jgi:hypothetical protein
MRAVRFGGGIASGPSLWHGVPGNERVGSDVSFKWTCFSGATVFGIVLLVLIVDLKRDVTESLDAAKAAVSNANKAMEVVNDRLPEMIGEVKTGTEALAGLAEDVELIKSLAGLNAERSKQGFRGLATYADDAQKVLFEHTEGKGVILMKEKLIGKKLEEVESMEEFLVGLSKEMVTLVLLAKSKQEILHKACYAGPPRRLPFYLKFPGEKPVSLMAFIKKHHPESAELPTFEN